MACVSRKDIVKYASYNFHVERCSITYSLHRKLSVQNAANPYSMITVTFANKFHEI